MGSPTKNNVRCLILYTTMSDPDWPDTLDLSTGTFIYYGDNKHPGKGLPPNPQEGEPCAEPIVRERNNCRRAGIHPADPPVLKGTQRCRCPIPRATGSRFVAVPQDEQLVAIWRSTREQRFQNYRAAFAVLNVAAVPRAWLNEIADGKPTGATAPKAWRKWVRTGVADRLLAPRELNFRNREEQLPADRTGLGVLSAIHAHFADRPHDFEQCAAQIWMMLAPATRGVAGYPPLARRRPRRHWALPDWAARGLGAHRLRARGKVLRTAQFCRRARDESPHISAATSSVRRPRDDIVGARTGLQRDP